MTGTRKNTRHRRARAFSLSLCLLVLVAAGTAAASEVDILRVGNGVEPVVAFNDVGSAVVVWEVTNGETIMLAGQQLDAFTRPIGDIFVLKGKSGSTLEPAVAFRPDGGFIVVWQETGDGSSEIKAQPFDAFTRPIGDTFLVSDVTTWSTQPAVGTDDMGNVVVAWALAPTRVPDHTSSFTNAVRRFDAFTRPIGDTFLFGQRRGDSPTALAVQPEGGFLVAWEDAGQNIRGRVFAGPSAFTRPIGDTFPINAKTTGEQTNPAATVTLDGNYTVVWERVLTDGSRSVVGRRVSASSGEPMGEEFEVSESAYLDEADPVLAADGKGNTVVAWQCTAKTGEGQICARMVAGFTRPIGDTFLVSQGGTARSPSIAAGGKSCDFIVVWGQADPWTRSLPQVLSRRLMVPLDLNP